MDRLKIPVSGARGKRLCLRRIKQTEPEVLMFLKEIDAETMFMHDEFRLILQREREKD